MFSQHSLEELAFLYKPRRLWTFSTGINEHSREGTPRAQAIAETKAPERESEGGVLEQWGEIELG